MLPSLGHTSLPVLWGTVSYQGQRAECLVALVSTEPQRLFRRQENRTRVDHGSQWRSVKKKGRAL